MRGRRRERGVALLVAILVVALLTVTVIPFFYDGRVEQAVASNLYTGLQASYLARSGVALAEGLLRLDMEGRDTRGIDSLNEPWAGLNNVPIGAGGGSVSIVVTDEAGKLNVNRLVSSGGGTGQRTGQVDDRRRSYLQRLLVIRGQDPGLVDALIDWLDPDESEVSGSGAERSYYQGLDPPYEPADGPLSTLAELRLVKGWTPEVFAAVAPFLTIYGDGKVNLNTAPPEVLMAMSASDRVKEAEARAIVEWRREKPFRQVTEITQVPGLSLPANEFNQADTTVQSAFFSVVATGGFRGSTAVVRAVLDRSGGQPRRIYWRAE